MKTQNIDESMDTSIQGFEEKSNKKNYFKDLKLNEEILRAVNDQGFTIPTSIQAETIPFLANYDGDFVGQAQTGTGKTLAYLLPLLQKLDSHTRYIQSLILTPTRELANQVTNEINKFSKYLGIDTVAVFGGSSVENQIQAIKRKKPQIIVGTPGRVMDFIKRKVLNFKEARYVILDEADEMLNMGFLDSVQTILSSFGKHKYLWMFSATMPKPILNLIKKEFSSPKIIKIKSRGLSNDNIEQRYYLVKERNHSEALSRILDVERDMYGLIFCKTKIQTKKLYEKLLSQGHLVESLHGDMSQGQRDYAMANFKKQKSKLMICTDVVARGIDVNNLTHVINFGLPQDLESYVHRIGRTGRAGKKGIAITILDPADMFRLKRLENFIKKNITRFTLPSFENIKESIVSRELQLINFRKKIFNSTKDNFKLDKSFRLFETGFKDLSKDDIIKLAFLRFLDSKFKTYNKTDLLDMDDSEDRRKNSVKFSSNGTKFRKHGNIKLFMNIGKIDGLKRKEFLEDFSNKFNIKKHNINNIEFKRTFSFLEIPLKEAKKLVNYKTFEYKGRKVRFEYSN